MSVFTVIAAAMVAGIVFAIAASVGGLVVVLVSGRRGRDGAWDSRPPHDPLRLRAGGGLGRGSSH